MGLPQGPVAVIKALAGRPCGLLGSVSRPLVEIERSAVGRIEASWRPQMVSMGAVRWKQRRPFRGERRREVWKKLGDDQLMARPRLPSFQPACLLSSQCLLSDLPQCATILGHNRSSQLLWQSVIVIATSCHNSSNLVGIFLWYLFRIVLFSIFTLLTWKNLTIEDWKEMQNVKCCLLKT